MVVALGLVLVVTGVAAALEFIPRNSWVGVRTQEAMRSDESWVRINREAAWSVLVAGAIIILGGILPALRAGARDAAALIHGFSVILALVVVALGAYLAG